MLAAPISPDAQPWLLLAFVLAFGIKVPLFPVHTWLPDAYTSAPTSTTVLMAGLMGKVGAYALLRFAFPLFPEAAVTWAPLIGVLAVLGIGYGAMIAVVQKDIKRLVAYSSISHLGFVMLGIAALTTQGVDGAVYVMLAHGVSTGGLFLLVGMLEERRGTTQISEFGGLAKVVPGISALLMIFVLTSVGLPGLAGFVGEFLVLMGAANSDIFFVSQTHWLSDAVGVGPELGAFVLTAMAAVGVILSAVYLLWMFQRVMFGPVVNPKNLDLKGLSPRELLYLAPLVALAFAMGLFPNFFLDKVRPSSEHFLSQLRPGIEAKTTQANPRALKRLDPGQVRRLTAELARERKREREAKVDAARQQREPKNDAKLPPGKMPTKPQDTAAVEKAKKVTRPEDLKLKPGTTLRLEKLFRGDKAEPKKEGEPSPNP
jgi:NADH-quinone oxidoreductase subunit M